MADANTDIPIWMQVTTAKRHGGRQSIPLWKLLYNKRGSVERAFGRLKEYRKLDNLKIRGLAKVELHAILAVMVMQAQALGSL